MLLHTLQYPRNVPSAITRYVRLRCSLNKQPAHWDLTTRWFRRHWNAGHENSRLAAKYFAVFLPYKGNNLCPSRAKINCCMWLRLQMKQCSRTRCDKTTADESFSARYIWTFSLTPGMYEGFHTSKEMTSQRCTARARRSCKCHLHETSFYKRINKARYRPGGAYRVPGS